MVKNLVWITQHAWKEASYRLQGSQHIHARYWKYFVKKGRNFSNKNTALWAELYTQLFAPNQKKNMIMCTVVVLTKHIHTHMWFDRRLKKHTPSEVENLLDMRSVWNITPSNSPAHNCTNIGHVQFHSTLLNDLHLVQHTRMIHLTGLFFLIFPYFSGAIMQEIHTFWK